MGRPSEEPVGAGAVGGGEGDVVDVLVERCTGEAAAEPGAGGVASVDGGGGGGGGGASGAVAGAEDGIGVATGETVSCETVTVSCVDSGPGEAGSEASVGETSSGGAAGEEASAGETTAEGGTGATIVLRCTDSDEGRDGTFRPASGSLASMAAASLVVAGCGAVPPKGFENERRACAVPMSIRPEGSSDPTA